MERTTAQGCLTGNAAALQLSSSRPRWVQRAPNHISKTVLSTVHDGGLEAPTARGLRLVASVPGVAYWFPIAPPRPSRASARRGSGCVQRRRPVTTTGRRPGPPPVVVYPRMAGGKAANFIHVFHEEGLSPHVRKKGWPRRRRRPTLSAPRGSCQHHRRPPGPAIAANRSPGAATAAPSTAPGPQLTMTQCRRSPSRPSRACLCYDKGHMLGVSRYDKDFASGSAPV